MSVPRPRRKGTEATRILADLDGEDKEILLERAQILKAFRTLRPCAAAEPSFHEKIHIDSGGTARCVLKKLR